MFLKSYFKKAPLPVAYPKVPAMWVFWVQYIKY